MKKRLCLVSLAAVGAVFFLNNVFWPENFVLVLSPLLFASTAENGFGLFMPSDILTGSEMIVSAAGFVYPPGIYLLLNGAFKIFGAHISVVNYLAFLSVLTVAPLSFVIMARYVRAPLAFIASLMIMTFTLKSHYYPDYLVIPPMLVLLWALIRRHETGRDGYLLLAGILAGLAAFIKHNIGIQLAVGSTFSLLWMFQRRPDDASGKPGFVQYAAMLVVFSAGLAFYPLMMRQALHFADLVYYFIPVVFMLGLSAHDGLRGGWSRDSLRGFLRGYGLFLAGFLAVMAVWMIPYGLKIGFGRYVYGLFFMGYKTFHIWYREVAPLVLNPAMAAPVFLAAALSGIAALRRERNVLVFLLSLSVLAALVVFIRLDGGGAFVAARRLWETVGYPASPFFFAWLVHASAMGYLALRRKSLNGEAAPLGLALVFSVFQTNSFYPSVDDFHIMPRLVTPFIVLAIFLALLLRGRAQWRWKYALFVLGLPLFFQPLNFYQKNPLLRPHEGWEKINERVDVNVEGGQARFLRGLGQYMSAHAGEGWFVFDSRSVMIGYYFLGGVKMPLPYVEVRDGILDEEGATAMVKGLEDKKPARILMGYDDYLQMIGRQERFEGNAKALDYFDEKYFTERLFLTDPEWEKVQIFPAVVLLRK